MLESAEQCEPHVFRSEADTLAISDFAALDEVRDPGLAEF